MLYRSAFLLLSMCSLSLLLGLMPPRLSAAAAEAPPRTIVAFGDSLTAGLGVPLDRAYPAQLAQRLAQGGYPYRVVNAGVSGDTTAGGLRRVNWVLQSKPSVVIVALGANDGLRGLKLADTRQNLEAIIERLQQASAVVVLAGMKLPPNYGADYTEGFEALFPALAKRYGLSLIPFLLEGVAAKPTLNQADGIHPTEEGYRLVTDTVYRTLAPLLEQNGGAVSLPAHRPQMNK